MYEKIVQLKFEAKVCSKIIPLERFVGAVRERRNPNLKGRIMLSIKEYVSINLLLEELNSYEGDSEKCCQIADDLISSYPEYNLGYLLKLKLQSKADDVNLMKDLLDQLIDKKTLNLEATSYPYEILNSKNPDCNIEMRSIIADFLRSRADFLKVNMDKTMNKTLFLKELFEIYDALKDSDNLEITASELIVRDFNYIFIKRNYSAECNAPHREKMNASIKKFYDSMNSWNNTYEEKMQVFSKVFSEIKFNSASLKVSAIDDWESFAFSYIPKLIQARNKLEFYENLVEMVHKIGDNHNRLSFPSDIEDKFTNPGLKVVYIDGKFYVGSDFNYSDTQIKAGDEIIQIDGIETNEYIEKNKNTYPLVKHYHFLPKMSAYYSLSNDLLTFPADNTLKVEFRTLKNSTYSIEFSKNIKISENNKSQSQSAVTVELLDKGILLIHITKFWGCDVYAAFLENIRKYDLKEIKGIIFDVRRNAGGNSGFGDRIFSHFISEDVKNYFMTYTKVHIPLHSLDGIEDLKLFDHVIIKPAKELKIDCPVAVLTSPYSGSATEGFVFLFKYYMLGMIIGLPTSGSTGNPLFSLLKGGGYLRVNLNISMYFTCKGIEPDIYVDNTISDLINGGDSQLEKAVSYLTANNLNN